MPRPGAAEYMAETKLKILAIDDKPDNLRVVQLVLAGALPGAAVITAGNGPRGLELALAEDPDVILLDIRMPGMDGFEVCRRLKADARTADIPVVFLTAAEIGNELSVKALEAGGECFLSKPFEELDLLSQVRTMAKIKAGNVARRKEKERLAQLLDERTHELISEAGELQRKGEALAEAEGRYSALFAGMSEGFSLNEIICDKDGHPVDYRFLDVNPAFEKLTGLSRAAVLGRTAREALPAVPGRLIEAYGHVALTRQRVRLENIADPSGRLFSITVFSPKRGQFAVLLTETTERKRAEENLARLHRQNKLILSSAAEGILGLDLQGNHNFVNPAAAKLLGWEVEELLEDPRRTPR